MSNFPTSLDSLTNPIATDPQNNPSHSSQHAVANDILEALESKVGINSSADANSLDYKIANKVEDSIVDGHTTVAPSGNSVFDALALKAPLASPTFTGLMTGKSLKEGEMENGHITVTVASGNLTVALQHEADDGTLNTPSATKIVRVKIGGVVRSITGALSGTWNSSLNWLNMGSAELATKEVDLFTYLDWSSVSNAIQIFITRYPGAKTFADLVTTGGYYQNEKGILNSAPDTFTTTDAVVNIGRFAATLSAGAGYTWSVPTFTASNLIQRPIYEADFKDFAIVVNWTGGTAPSGSPAHATARYKIVGKRLLFQVYLDGFTAGATVTVGAFVLPFTALQYFAAVVANITAGNAPNYSTAYVNSNSCAIFCNSVSATRIYASGFYEI